jgi:hypothetical protein
MASIEDLLDGYLSGNTGPLLDPSVGAADARAGGEVTLRGVADDAAMGAVVVEDDGHVTLLAGVEAWPAELRGRRVEVSGLLTSSPTGPTGGLGPNGEASHGAVGNARTLLSPRWALAS